MNAVAIISEVVSYFNACYRRAETLREFGDHNDLSVSTPLFAKQNISQYDETHSQGDQLLPLSKGSAGIVSTDAAVSVRRAVVRSAIRADLPRRSRR